MKGGQVQCGDYRGQARSGEETGHALQDGGGKASLLHEGSVDVVRAGELELEGLT